MSPVQGDSTVWIQDGVMQLSVPRVTHLGRLGETLGSWHFITSVWTNLCNEVIVHLLTYFPGQQQHQLLQEKKC